MIADVPKQTSGSGGDTWRISPNHQQIHIFILIFYLSFRAKEPTMFWFTKLNTKHKSYSHLTMWFLFAPYCRGTYGINKTTGPQKFPLTSHSFSTPSHHLSPPAVVSILPSLLSWVLSVPSVFFSFLTISAASIIIYMPQIPCLSNPIPHKISRVIFLEDRILSTNHFSITSRCGWIT